VARVLRYAQFWENHRRQQFGGWIVRRERSLKTFGTLFLVSVLLFVPFAAHAQKLANSYPEEGKVIGRGTTEHTMSPTYFYTQTYKVQTDKVVCELDCGKKPFFGKTGGECGGEKKLQIGDVIHFRTEKNSVYILVKEPGSDRMQEEKLRIMSQETRPDSTAGKPPVSQP
jgi:hypothetical protein